MKKIAIAALVAGMGLQVAYAADDKVTICVFDPSGQHGYAYGYAKDYMVQAPRFGVIKPIDLKVYTNEEGVVTDFKTGRCDAAIMSSLRAREFNSYTGSLDAVGGLQNIKDLNLALQVLSSKSLAPKMVQGDYEILGIIPIGAAYMMVDDRRINTFSKGAGKKVAILNLEKSANKLTQKIGAIPVRVDLNTVADAFNNHKVNVLAAPAVAFRPFELAKGMTGPDGSVKGGVVRFPLAQITASFVVRKSKLPNPDVSQKIREYIFSQLGTAYKFIDNAEKDIDDKYWINMSPADQQSTQTLMRTTRIEMIKDGIYDKDMMHLLKKIRCKTNPNNPECNSNDE